MLAGYLFHIPVVMFCADLMSSLGGRNFLLYARGWLQREFVKIASGVVVLSSHVGRDLRHTRPWIRVSRPPAPDILYLPKSIPNSDTRILYFAGSTSKVSGVDLLLEAIQHIHDPTYRFWFSGRGPLDRTIYEAARTDKRIIHWGFVKRERYRELLQQANVLVNPRPTRLPENRYNFPSKLMEYMAAGRPVISTATSDIAEYYLDEIVLLEDETPEGLARLITEVCSWSPERQIALGQKARNRVQKETWEIQAQRILDFIENLSS
jgi:glycosyltransferase involved in cell wall biosynthesis